MILKAMSAPIILKNGNSTFSFLSGGDSFEWLHESIMINSFRGNTLNGSPGNIYLRIFKDNSITFYPLIGLASGSSLHFNDISLIFEGRAEQVDYKVTFRLTPYGIWFWDISLSGICHRADIVYSQDIGMALKGGIITNELYTAQYLGHRIFEGNYGYVICSRQNMPQNGSYPYLQQGSLGISTIAYSTDGTQFFGLSYKKTNIPEALYDKLPSKNKQYELSHTALQTEEFSLSGTKEFSFYGIIKSNHPDTVDQLEFSKELNLAYSYKTPLQYQTMKVPSHNKIGSPYASIQWSEAMVDQYFPNRMLEEKAEGKLLSFFTSDNSHVVLQEKELITERPHGHIIMTNFDLTKVPKGVVSSTNYMYGIFNCQLVAGNTSYNKLLSNHRGLLNVERNSGQRIYVKIDDEYRQLTLPAAYEMMLSGSRWYYQLEDDVLIVTSFVMFHRPEVVLKVQSVNQKKYDFIVTHQLTLGPGEYENDIVLTHENNIIEMRPSDGAVTNDYYPNLHFRMRIPANSTLAKDDIFFTDNTVINPSLLSILVPSSANFDIVIQGYEDEGEIPFLDAYDYETQKIAYGTYYKNLTNDFLLAQAESSLLVQKVNTILPWYAHNALIHFASPHGLEQSGGAAWGTRDVCQGPVEFFLTTGHFKLIRNILLTLFSHQLDQSFEWPQWFMFDEYTMHQEDCHGDVIFWPLKSISDYILSSGDTSILKEVVDYRNPKDAKPAGRSESILNHIKRAMDSIKKRYLPGTALISYAGGDWDDTLQPANHNLRDNLVSAWTQALAIQTLDSLASSLAEVDSSLAFETSHMAMELKNDFYQYLIKDGVVAGFLYKESEENMKYMLHPADTETSIHYRLLPLTRSIIAQIADSKLAEKNMELIEEHLACPDGVRLMDHPACYSGGNSKIFLRAEQAANVGREISLQYVHAHIRYVEALTTLGLADKAWDAILRITPILLNEYVPNALTRQSNVYYSSSDGCFDDRYEYSANFHKLRTGHIPVKGGWRLYSSGPGIYIRRIIADLLGIRLKQDSIIIDPVLTKELDGLSLQYNCFGTTISFNYHVDSKSSDPIQVICGDKKLSGIYLKNPYRNSGIQISKEDFLDAVVMDKKIHVYI